MKAKHVISMLQLIWVESAVLQKATLLRFRMLSKSTACVRSAVISFLSCKFAPGGGLYRQRGVAGDSIDISHLALDLSISV